MGKKTKVGKQRKDKFYHLAKETGYRSRSAFKLIQLNRKFEFLQKSRVLIDLCAAPGGWMQVAVEHMPVSSLVIGVDLFPIKPISGCISFTEDITTDKCLHLIKKELKTWKADVVLHDGAPNVGQNWHHDAYQQTVLTLHAFKLATEVLRSGGYFVTKVFRSKDYNALYWVLKQFFRGIFATKPSASRIESAEIFIVCKGYLAPSTIDPKLLDPKHVFEDVEVPESKKKIQQLLFNSAGKKAKALGYPTDEALLYRPILASEFILNSDYMELIANTSEIKIDEDWISKNVKTTEEIKEFCKDVKVLSRKELKSLFQWRKVMREKLDQFAALKAGKESEVEEEKVEVSEDEDEKLELAIANLKETELRTEKRKKKKLIKDRKKVEEKTNLKMIIPGDVGPTDIGEDTFFTLKSIRTKDDVNRLTDAQVPHISSEEELDEEEELDRYEAKQKAKYVTYKKEDEVLDKTGKFYKKREMESDSENESEDEDPDVEGGLEFEDDKIDEPEMDIDEMAPEIDHPLITDLDHSEKSEKRIRKAQMWFDKDVFNNLDDESDEEVELQQMAETYIKKGFSVPGIDKPEPDSNPKLNGKGKKTQEEDFEWEEEKKERKPKKKKGENGTINPGEPKKKKIKLTVEDLALGSLMVESKKMRRDLCDDAWNRYAFNDPGLPDWFLNEERKHMKKDVPVPPELVEDYKKNLREINARPIKKVVEAKARKKKRAVRKLEKAKKKAESILDKADMTENEKANTIRQLYKKATGYKKKETTYVVAKKFSAGKRAKRPAGVKGKFKSVDPRMKKDMKKMKMAAKKEKGNKKSMRNKKGKR